MMFLIKLYWLLPARSRSRCLFKESCSRIVYRTAKEKGFVKGVKALLFRMRSCRGGYVLHTMEGRVHLVCADGSVIKEEEVSERLVKHFCLSN
jgi:hypothetical protein